MENLYSVLTWLACPLGMGLLMWLLMGAQQRQGMGSRQLPADVPASRPGAETSPDDRLAQLRAQLGEVRAQRAALTEQIERLAAEDQSVEPREVAPPVPTEPAAPPSRRPVAEDDASRRGTAGRSIQQGGPGAREHHERLWRSTG